MHQAHRSVESADAYQRELEEQRTSPKQTIPPVRWR